MSLENAVRNVTDYPSLMTLFAEELEWDIDPARSRDDVTFDWTSDELKLPESSAQRLKDGLVRQLRFKGAQPPLGVFFVEFNDDRIYRTALRQVLRGLVPKRRWLMIEGSLRNSNRRIFPEISTLDSGSWKARTSTALSISRGR